MNNKIEFEVGRIKDNQIMEINSLNILTDNFSEVYPEINRMIFEKGKKVSSRNGKVKEISDVKTTITSPLKRCTSGYGRGMNIFFLLYEAIWIWCGEKDVESLSWFLKNMEHFSDDGIVFHAPYGFRLRKWGVESESRLTEENKHHYQGLDQIFYALKMLSEDPSSRRVVCSIWNPELDLNVESKDLPCNDLLMFKIINNELKISICNRSNDLHWGLPTNIFQFSFLGEIFANILDFGKNKGIKYTRQTHFSDSLHIYLDNLIPSNLYSSYMSKIVKPELDLYNHNISPMEMNFNFSSENDFRKRLTNFDSVLKNMIFKLKALKYDDISVEEFDKSIEFTSKSSSYFGNIMFLLKIFIMFKKESISLEEAFHTIQIQFFALKTLKKDFPADYYIMGLNYFFCIAKKRKINLKVDSRFNEVIINLGSY